MANTTILEKIKSSGRFASVDAKWGPYASVAAAHAKLGEDGDDVAVIGLTVGVMEGNQIVEYWYQGGTALANLTRKTVSVDGELSPSSDNPVTNEVLYEGFDSLGKDVTVVTAVGTEVTGGNKANLTAPSDYSAGTIFHVNSGVDGSNYSPFVDGILYYVALAAGSSGDSLEDNAKFYSTYSSTDALSKRVDLLNAITSGGVYSIKRKVDEHSTMLRTSEENGAYFTDGSGNVFMQYEDETGFDVAKISQSFKDKLGGGTGRNNIVRDIKEDVISLVTDELGNSAVNWSNEHGLDANKVSYHLAKSIRGRQIKDMEEWRNLAVGMFIHWGVYSVLAGHYQGFDVDGQIVDYQSTIIAEWIMKLAKIPKATYQSYESQFTAVNWDADAIAKLAYDCGMKYIVITAKHHEGFALYDSQVISWNISTSGAAGKDPMQELKNACEKYGIKFCIYYSVGRDWTAEGGFDQEWANNNVAPYTNMQHEAYMSSCANALKEIVDRYNPYIIWYDGYINTPLNEIVYDAQKNYFPQVIVNDRLCHNPAKGDYATGEGAYYQGDRSEWPYAENCYCVMKNSWGYNENQDTPEYANSLYELLCKEILESRARTQNSLINIGPKGDGSVSANAINALNSLADFINKYGSFENTKGLNYYTFPSWGRAIIKGRTLRCYVWGGNTTILVDGVYTKPIKGVKVWDIQDPESANNYTIVSDYRIRVANIPVNAQHPSVVDIEFGNDIVFEEYSTIIDSDNIIIGASAFQAHGNMYLTNFGGVVQFGGWTQSGRITSIFRYEGVSGNHAVKLYIPSKFSNGIPITIKVTDLANDNTTTLTVTSDDTTTQESVYLTNGRNYEVDISKTANDWFNLSQIEFIQTSSVRLGDTLPLLLGGSSGQSTQLGEDLPITLS